MFNGVVMREEKAYEQLRANRIEEKHLGPT